MYQIIVSIPKALLEKLSSPEEIMKTMESNPEGAMAQMIGLNLMKTIMERHGDRYKLNPDFFNTEKCSDEEKRVRDHGLVAFAAMIASQEKENLDRE